MSNLEEWVNGLKNLKNMLDKAEDKVTVDLIVSNYTYEDKVEIERINKVAEDSGLWRVSSVIQKALKQLKKQAHPEVNGVKYYAKYINNLKTRLTDEQKLALDNRLYEMCRPNYIHANLTSECVDSDKENDLLKELYMMGAIAPAISIYCGCGEDIYICNVEYHKGLAENLGLPYDAELSEIQEEIYCNMECNGCDNEYLEDQSSSVAEAIKLIKKPEVFFHFKVAKQPDMTIDNL